MNREEFRKASGEAGYKIIKVLTSSLGARQHELEKMFADFAETILKQASEDTRNQIDIAEIERGDF